MKPLFNSSSSYEVGCFLAVRYEKSFVFKLNINVLLFVSAEFKIPS